jgi:hypothetical protein
MWACPDQQSGLFVSSLRNSIKPSHFQQNITATFRRLYDAGKLDFVNWYFHGMWSGGSSPHIMLNNVGPPRFFPPSIKETVEWWVLLGKIKSSLTRVVTSSYGQVFVCCDCSPLCAQNLTVACTTFCHIPTAVPVQNLIQPNVMRHFRTRPRSKCNLRSFYVVTQLISTFRDNIPVSYSWITRPLKVGPICCPETSVMNNQCTLRIIPQGRRSDLILIEMYDSSSRQ